MRTDAQTKVYATRILVSSLGLEISVMNNYTRKAMKISQLRMRARWCPS